MADTKFLDNFDDEARNLAIKCIAYYDGRSKAYLEKYLQSYRRNALSKGMKPRTRNIVKQVIDKSGMLFNRAPVLNVYPEGADNVTIDENASRALQAVMEEAQWIEFFTNVDPMVRLLKTVHVLVQHDATTKETFFTLLTQANSAVHIENRKVTTLIYFTGRDGDLDTYRIWTNELVQDLVITDNGDERVVGVVPNPYGIIPIATFHDTNLPRDGYWNPIPEDLIEINDILNLHLTDAEYAIAHSKMQTLFTNAVIQGSTLGGSLGATTVVDYGSKLGPRHVHSPLGEGFVGGPGEAVALETGGEAVYLDYKGPKPDIEPLDKVIQGWVSDFAGDWSVSVANDAAGFGAADSGFKLVVKEIPNMELRKKRQRMFEAGFAELYEVLLVINETFPLGLTSGTELYVVFTAPELPVDEKASEEVWSRKIKEGRSSDVEYFMVVQGLSRQEAEEKVLVLAADRALLRPVPATVTPMSIAV